MLLHDKWYHVTPFHCETVSTLSNKLDYWGERIHILVFTDHQSNRF